MGIPFGERSTERTLTRLCTALGMNGNRAILISSNYFDLTISEMEYLRLDTKNYAMNMARGLSIPHRKAVIDANDVEFVPGSVPNYVIALTLKELLGFCVF